MLKNVLFKSTYIKRVNGCQMLVFLYMFILVGFSYAAPCPSTDGLIASTNVTCECETDTSGETTCETGEYCAVQGNEALCLDNPLCSPNSFNVGDPCYCSNDITQLGNKCMNYCHADYTCSDYPKCEESSDPLATDCCYGSCGDTATAQTCEASSTYTDDGCIPPDDICTDASSSQQNCEVVSRCTNETSCYDEFDVLNGCGEMPDEFQGNNACGDNAACSRGYCLGCPDAISQVDQTNKCRCDCAAYYDNWLGERQCSELKETYKEAYNICECNLC